MSSQASRGTLSRAICSATNRCGRGAFVISATRPPCRRNACKAAIAAG